MTPAALADLVRSVARDVLTSRGLDPEALPPRVTVQRPREPGHGDYATTVALQAAKKVGVAPREFAGWLAQELTQRDGVRCAKVAGPGFLNLWLGPQARAGIVTQVLAAGRGFGTSQDLDINPDLWAEGTGGAPLFPAQYAHARLASLARNAADLGISSENAKLSLLDHEREGELIRMLGEFPRIVSSAAQLREPHRVARHLEELASAYHRFAGTCRVLPQGDETACPRHAARLALCEATRLVLGNGLELLGMSAPEQM